MAVARRWATPLLIAPQCPAFVPPCRPTCRRCGRPGSSSISRLPSRLDYTVPLSLSAAAMRRSSDKQYRLLPCMLRLPAHCVMFRCSLAIKSLVWEPSRLISGNHAWPAGTLVPMAGCGTQPLQACARDSRALAILRVLGLTTIRTAPTWGEVRGRPTSSRGCSPGVWGRGASREHRV